MTSLVYRRKSSTQHRYMKYSPRSTLIVQTTSIPGPGVRRSDFANSSLDKLNIALSPGSRSGRGEPSGQYVELTDALRSKGMLGQVVIGQPLHVEEALASVRQTFEDRDNVTKFQEVLRAYEKSDDYRSWLNWMARNGWVEQVGRTGGLINHQLLDELSLVLADFGVGRSDLDELARNSSNRTWVGRRVAEMRENEESSRLARAQVGSALIRAVYQERLARLQVQTNRTGPDPVAESIHLHIHPIRVPVLFDDGTRIEQLSSSSAQEILALIILNHAEPATSLPHPNLGLSLHRARLQWPEVRLYLDGNPFEDVNRTVELDEARRRAQKAASFLGVGVGAHFETIIEKAMTLGLVGAGVASGFVLKQWPETAVAVGIGIAGLLDFDRRIAEKSETVAPWRRRRLDTLAMAPSGPVFSSQLIAL